MGLATQYLVSLLTTASTTFLLGLFVILCGPKRLSHRIFGLYSWSIALWSIGQALHSIAPDVQHSLWWAYLSHYGVIFIPTFFVHFVVSFLGVEPRRRLGVLVPCYTLSLLFAVVNGTPLYIAGVAQKFSLKYFIEPGPFYAFSAVFFVVCTAYGLTSLFRAYARASGALRNQLRYLCWSSLLGYLGGAANFFLVFDVEIIPWNPFGTYAVPLYVLVTTYAIVRYRLMDINLAITRTTVFMAVYALALGVPLMVALSLQPQLERSMGSRWWVWLWVACALLATVAHYANFYFQRFAENRLLKEQRRYQATLRQASEGMTRVRQLPRLLKLTVSILSKAMGLTYAAIYLVDSETKCYVRQVRKARDGERAPERLDPTDPLIRYLLVHKNAVVAEEFHMERRGTADPGLREVEMSLRRLGAALVIPSFVHDQLLGFVVMGAKRSGKIYTDDDIKVLMTLANQAGLAIENARFYESEKERQAEMFHTAQLASLGTMAGSMGHQINNRFNTESILAGTLREALRNADLTGVPDPIKGLIGKAEVTFDKIEKDAIRGGDIVKMLLNFSKPDKMERAAFPEILEMSNDLAQYRVKFEEIDYEAVLANPLPILNANRNQLTEVFFNLLSNAYDAIKSKEQAIQEGRLRVAGGVYKGRLAITVTTADRNGAEWLQAVVHDSGIGIKQEDLSRLFVPFFTTKATSQKGTGLGLYVIKRIVENHGGKVEVNSIYGEGTTFTILLPAFTEKG